MFSRGVINIKGASENRRLFDRKFKIVRIERTPGNGCQLATFLNRHLTYEDHQ